MASLQPVNSFRAGQVSCALWENDIIVRGQQKTIVKASISRRYKDRDGNWQTSQSFSRHEIPLAIYCLNKAFEAMLENPSSQAEMGQVEEVVIE